MENLSFTKQNQLFSKKTICYQIKLWFWAILCKREKKLTFLIKDLKDFNAKESKQECQTNLAKNKALLRKTKEPHLKPICV